MMYTKKLTPIPRWVSLLLIVLYTAFTYRIHLKQFPEETNYLPDEAYKAFFMTKMWAVFYFALSAVCTNSVFVVVTLSGNWLCFAMITSGASCCLGTFISTSGLFGYNKCTHLVPHCSSLCIGVCITARCTSVGCIALNCTSRSC